MRHGDKVNNLGRTMAHRRALLANLAISLIEHKRIVTTLAKAKALRVYIEPLVTKAKDNTTHQRRVVFSYLQNKEAVKELFDTVVEKVGDRPGGYVRVIKMGFRRGDGAETAMIEFVDFNETYQPNAGKVKTAKKTRRGGSKKVAAGAVAEEPAAPVVEAAAEEANEVVAEVEEAVAPVEEVVAAAEETVEVAAEEVADVAAETEAAVEEVVAEATEDVAEAPAAEEEEKKDEEQA
ncbi:MAG: 50S ribosomal protein L17 [Saprospiraceae bacterium]|nr:50S ribosomal protein L17 [Saprospiraceae bacterium]